MILLRSLVATIWIVSTSALTLAAYPQEKQLKAGTILTETPPKQGFIFIKPPGKEITVEAKGLYLEQKVLEDTVVRTIFGNYVWQKLQITDQPHGDTYVGWRYWGPARKPGEIVLFAASKVPNLMVFNFIIGLVPFICYFLGIVIRKVAFPGNKSSPLSHQFLLGIPVSLVVVFPLLPIINKAVSDLPAFLVTMGIIIEHGMLVNETATYHLKTRFGELRAARPKHSGAGRIEQ